MKLVVFLLGIVAVDAFSQQAPLRPSSHQHTLFAARHNKNGNEKGELDPVEATISIDRRSFAVSALSLVSFLAVPQTAQGIDVSGLRVEGSSQGNSAIVNQLKAYDGSGATRVQEIKQQATPPSSPSPYNVSPSPSTPPIDRDAATNAMRYTEPRISKVGLAGLKSRYEGQIVGPTQRPLYVSFEFPSDWLWLDKFQGGVQYVDQRNGDKLYLLRATLPDDTSLETVSKQWFGDVIFNPKGTVAKQNEVDEYKVSRSQNTTEPGGAPRRRLTLKFFTVTGNGLRVERRGLVDAIQVDNDVYMLVTSSNANKFEAKGKERETVEAIVDSFRLERQ